MDQYSISKEQLFPGHSNVTSWGYVVTEMSRHVIRTVTLCALPYKNCRRARRTRMPRGFGKARDTAAWQFTEGPWLWLGVYHYHYHWDLRTPVAARNHSTIVVPSDGISRMPRRVPDRANSHWVKNRTTTNKWEDSLLDISSLAHEFKRRPRVPGRKLCHSDDPIPFLFPIALW